MSLPTLTHCAIAWALSLLPVACLVGRCLRGCAQTCEDAGEDGADWDERYITRTHDRSNAA